MSEKTLPERMREAALVLRQVDKRRDEGLGLSDKHENVWRAGTLQGQAEIWEAEDSRKVQIDGLAIEILKFENNSLGNGRNPSPQDYAEFIHRIGYRKDANEQA